MPNVKEEVAPKKMITLGLPDGRNIQVEYESDEKAVEKGRAFLKAEDEVKSYSQEFVNLLDKIDQEPTEPTPRRMPYVGYNLRGGPPLFPQAPEPTNEDPTEQLKHDNAAALGVDIRTGAPGTVRAKAAMFDNVDPNLAAEVLDSLLQKELSDQGRQLPTGMPALFKDESTGKLAYYRPTGDGKYKPTLVNPYGPDVGDVLSVADTLLGGVVEGGAGYLATIGTKSLVGGTMAAAVANAGVNTMRRELAKEFGVPAELADKIDSDYIFGEMLWTAGFDTAGPLAAAMVRKGRDVYRPLSSDFELAVLKSKISTMLRHEQELNSRLGTNMHATPGQLTGDPRLLLRESDVRSSVFGEKSAKLNMQDYENRGEMRNALVAIHDGVVPTGPRRHSVDAVGDDVRDIIYNPVRLAEQDVFEQTMSLNDIVGKVDPTRSAEFLNRVNVDVSTAYDAARKHEDTSWAAFRAAIGYDPTTRRSAVTMVNDGDETPIKIALHNLREEGQMALSEAFGRAQLGLARDLGLGEAEDATVSLARLTTQWNEAGGLPRPDRLRARSRIDDQRDAIRGKAAEQANARLMSSDLDLEQVHRVLSDLKRQRRTIDRSTDPNGWRDRDVGTMITAIEEQTRNGSFRKGADALDEEMGSLITDTFRVSNSATVDRANFFRGEAAREKLFTMKMADEDGKVTAVMADPGQIWKSLFQPNSTDSLRNVMDVVHDNPEVRTGLLRELHAEYRKRALPTDAEGVVRFNQVAHATFLDSYGDHINLLAGERSTDFIRNAADMSKTLARREGNLQRVKIALKNFYGNKMKDGVPYGRNIADDIINGSWTTEQIKGLRSSVQGADPDLWASIQKHGLDQLRDSMLKASMSEGNVNVMNKTLLKHGEPLKAMYGAGYVHDLKVLRDYMAAIEGVSKAPGSKIVGNPPLLLVTRSIFGPLDPIQRRISAGRTVHEALKRNAAYNMMADPALLNKYVKLGAFKPTDYAFLVGLMELGVAFYDMPEETQAVANRVAKKRIDVGYPNPQQALDNVNAVRSGKAK